MTIKLNYPFVQALAVAMQKEAEDGGLDKLTARPYNRFEPADSLWWLVPTTDWPSFRHGKIVFAPNLVQLGVVTCGLHVEKGYGRKVKNAVKSLSETRVLSNSWAWPGLLADLGNGRFAGGALQVAERSGEPVVLKIDVFQFDDSGEFGLDSRFDSVDGSLASRNALGSFRFDVNGDQLSLHSQSEVKREAQAVAACQRLGDLAALFKDPQVMKKWDWFWVDVYAGVNIELALTQANTATGWPEPTIWRNVVHPWMPWVR